MNYFFADFQKLFETLAPVIIFLITLVVGLSLRRFLFGRLARWAQGTKTEVDDIIIVSTKGPFLIWCLMLGIYFALETSPLRDDLVHIAGKILLVLGIISVTMVVSSILSKFVKLYSGKIESALPVTSLTQHIARIVVFGVGIMVVLNSLGISITPILATLGVGGLAVALALQDTLSNLFAGFHIIVARQIKIGDYIKLDSGEEGYVADITWRTTKIKMLPNNVVLIPNDKLSKAIVVNYYLPDQELAVPVNVGVHYTSDLKKVERVTVEVAREVMKEVPGGVPQFEPVVRYHTLGDFSVNFTVVLRAKEFVDQYLIKHEFIKRLHERYAKEGICIPYPVRAINYEQEKADTAA
jgi:small-conductance mechanosensitive channel